MVSSESENQRFVSEVVQAAELQGRVPRGELQIANMSQDMVSSKAEKDRLMVEERQRTTLYPRKLGHQIIPKHIMAPMTRRTELLALSGIEEVSSSYCGLNKRSIAKRISMLSSRNRNLANGDLKISSGLRLSKSSKRLSHLTEGCSTVAPTPVFAARSSNHAVGFTMHFNQHAEKGSQKEVGLPKYSINLDRNSIRLGSPEVFEPHSEPATRPNTRPGTPRSQGCINFKRARGSSLPQNHGDTDEAAKFKSESFEGRRLKKFRASPILNFFGTPSSCHMPMELGTPITPHSRVSNMPGSGVILQTLILKYCNSVNLTRKKSSKNPELYQDIPEATECQPVVWANLSPMRKPSVLPSRSYLGDCHSSVSLSEKDFGEVPSFGLSRSETLSKRIAYTKQITARCDTGRLQVKQDVPGKQIGNTCPEEKKLILDTNLDLDLLLVPYPTLQQKFEMDSR